MEDDYRNHSEYSEKYPNPVQKLSEIYRKRNDLVHKDVLVIQNIDELSEICHFMSNIVFGIGVITLSRKFKITTDIQLIIENNGKTIDIELG